MLEEGCTSQCHPRLEALLQSAGRAVLPPQLVDGAVVPAGAKVFLFAWTRNHMEKPPVNW